MPGARKRVWSYNSSVIKVEEIERGGVRRLIVAPGEEGCVSSGGDRHLGDAVRVDRAAAAVVEGARARAEEILRRAGAEADEIRKGARKRGRQGGRRE
ncbi:MAG: hypothetical protein R6U70_06265, partial [Bacillota bacterium]